MTVVGEQQTLNSIPQIAELDVPDPYIDRLMREVTRPVGGAAGV
jgi:hypothetical protein